MIDIDDLIQEHQGVFTEVHSYEEIKQVVATYPDRCKSNQWEYLKNHRYPLCVGFVGKSSDPTAWTASKSYASSKYSLVPFGFFVSDSLEGAITQIRQEIYE